MSHKSKVHQFANENLNPSRKNPKYSNKNKKPIAGRLECSKSHCTSITPNFGRLSPKENQKKSQLSKQSIEYIFEDSLNFSEISERERVDQENCAPVTNQEIYAKKPLSICKYSENNFDDKLFSYFEKYDKAFCILQTNFTSHREETEMQISKLHEEVATVKNNLKIQVNIKNKISNLIDHQIFNTKSELTSELNCYLDKIAEFQSEKPPANRKSTLERIKKIREDYDNKLIENEMYISSLKQNNASNNRSKSSSRGYEDIAEENKKLREELSKMWNNY